MEIGNILFAIWVRLGLNLEEKRFMDIDDEEFYSVFKYIWKLDIDTETG